jgi:hypothetical protein
MYTSKKMIEIEYCSECPYKSWNENHKTSECSRKNNKVINAIGKIQAWCPLPEVPACQMTEDQLKLA